MPCASHRLAVQSIQPITVSSFLRALDILDTSALLAPLTLTSDPFPSMKNPASILTSVTTVIACDRARASVAILDINVFLQWFHNLHLRGQLYPRFLTLGLANSLAWLTIPAIKSDIMLNETLSTSPMFWRNFPFSKPNLLSCKPFLCFHLFLALSRSDVFLVEIAEMVSIVVLPSESRSGSLTLRVITRETVFLILRCVNVLVMTFEIGRATENVLFS
jgi:hypothetical protein